VSSCKFNDGLIALRCTPQVCFLCAVFDSYPFLYLTTSLLYNQLPSALLPGCWSASARSGAGRASRPHSATRWHPTGRCVHSSCAARATTQAADSRSRETISWTCSEHTCDLSFPSAIPPMLAWRLGALCTGDAVNQGGGSQEPRDCKPDVQRAHVWGFLSSSTLLLIYWPKRMCGAVLIAPRSPSIAMQH
jgi:hypothetical protein